MSSTKTTLQLPSNNVSRAWTKYEDKKSRKKRLNAKNRRRKKKIQKTKKKSNKIETREEMEAPKSFIVVRGSVTKNCKLLRDNLRLVFSPFTAAKLRVCPIF